MRRRVLAGAALTAALVGTLAARSAYLRGRLISLDGRVAVVAGGSRGLGLLIARELLWRGCRVAVCARDPDELDEARRWLGGGSDVLTVACDVGDPDSVGRMVAAVRDRLGPVDVLVNNAGIITVGPSASMSPEDYRASMDVMFWGAFNCSSAVLPEMRRRGFGRICNITSVGGKVPVPHLVPYVASKFAAVGFSESLGADLAGSGVVVTTIVPGLMRTGSHLAAVFKGSPVGEYSWFAPAASLPLLSMDAERAASQVVDAIEQGRPARILGLPAQLAVRLYGVAPSTTLALLALAGRVLEKVDSSASASSEGSTGAEVRGRAPSVVRRLTSLGDRAAARFQSPNG